MSILPIRMHDELDNIQDDLFSLIDVQGSLSNHNPHILHLLSSETNRSVWSTSSAINYGKQISFKSFFKAKHNWLHFNSALWIWRSDLWQVLSGHNYLTPVTQICQLKKVVNCNVVTYKVLVILFILV